MRALSLEGPRRFSVSPRPRPEPAPDEVVVRVEGCGVCGSSLPLWEARSWFEYPLAPGAPGHEGWGRVTAVGDDVDTLEEGARVAFLSGHAFAEADVAPVQHTVVLPSELDGVAFPGEAFGCAFNVARRSAIRPGTRVAVVGVGFLGAVLVALACRAGAEVTAFSRRAFARRVAHAQGAVAAYPLDDVGAHEEGFDCVLEAGGVQATLDVAARLARIRGRLVLAGYHQDARTVDLQLWNWRGLDVVNAHERDPLEYVRGMQEAVEAVVTGWLDPAAFVTHSVPLERAGEAFELAVERPDGFLKAVVLP